jgi:predicted GNAT family acetyltransferase
MSESLELRDNPSMNRFELVHDGQMSILRYTRAPGRITLIHTEVPVAQRGRGLGTRLVEFALANARNAGLSVVAVCPFVQQYLRNEAPSRPEQ